MVNRPVEKVRGMLDLLPDEQRVQQVVAVLEAHIAAYGYRAVELPVLEQTELYLRKVGQEMAGKLYAFRHHNRDLCLRPELRRPRSCAYVAYFQNASLPLRLAYSGPVFRYETPGRGRYRQFTEVGVELIGAGPPAADAEVIHIAAAGLERLGLRDYSVVIGHIGVAQAFLAGLSLDERVRDWLTWSMEDLRQHDEEQVHHALSALLPLGQRRGVGGRTGAGRRRAVGRLGRCRPTRPTRVVLRVLGSAGFDLRQSPAGGDRPPAGRQAGPAPEQCRRRSSAGPPAPAGPSARRARRGAGRAEDAAGRGAPAR